MRPAFRTLALAAMLDLVSQNAVAQIAEAQAPVAGAESDVARFEELSDAFRSVYERVAPAVVLIRTSGDMELRLPRFHPRLEPRPEQGPDRSPRFSPRFGPDQGEGFSGVGSGVIVSQDGYILSNHHVIRNADSIEITLHDQRRLTAQVVGVDSLIDIALLKVDAEGLPTALLGSSQDLQIGQWVLAIGFPLDMGSTLTHGIISALGRQAEVIRGDGNIESFIQTNAVINPGNSGGPLLDLRGRIVGINTAISTKTGYFMGYGLAVPIDLAREAMDDLLEHGRVVRGYLGISMVKVDANMVREQQLNLEPPRGVFLDSIYADTPASRGGLARGDVVLSVEGHPVNEPNEVQTLIYGRDPGDSVGLTIVRSGNEQDVSIVLGEREQDQMLARGHRRIEQLGLTVAPLTAERAQELGFTSQIAQELSLRDTRTAVVVTEIDPQSPAADRGLQVHDILTQIDKSAVHSVDEFVDSLSRLEPGESALFWFWRADLGVDVRSLPIQRTE